MGMGVFMNNQQQPVFGFYATHINQDRQGMGLKVAESIDSKGLSQRSCKNLDGWLLPRMKTLVASVYVGIELAVYRFNVFTYPGANRNAVSHVIHSIYHLQIQGKTTNPIQII